MSNAVKIKECYEKRAGIIKQMHALTTETDGKFNPEQQQRFDQMEADESAITRQIETLRKVDELMSSEEATEEFQQRRDFEAKKRDVPTAEDYRAARQAWLLRGSKHELTDKQIEVSKKCGVDLASNTWRVSLYNKPAKSVAQVNEWMTRATTAVNVAGTTGLGAETVDTILRSEIERCLLYYGGVRRAGATVIRTAGGQTMNFPTNDDTGNVSAVVTEAGARDVKGLEFRQKSIQIYMYTTSFVKASLEFIQDANFNVGSFIGEQFGIRMGRGTNSDFTNGATDLAQPFGLATEAAGSTVYATTANNTITYLKLLDLQHAVDAAYRELPTCGWMMHDVILKACKSIVDGNNRPMWQPSLAGLEMGVPDRLMGHPYTVNNNMSTGTTATKIILFGPMEKYVIRDVLDLNVVRVNERFIDNGLVAWIGHHRHGGRTIAATTGTTTWPIQCLANST